VELTILPCSYPGYCITRTDNNKEPLIKYKLSLAYRLVRDEGIVLTAWLVTQKNINAKHGPACMPRRARLEGFIYVVAALIKD